MTYNFKYRQFVHYALIICTILIQLIILVFFYNEYYNEKKLVDIKRQMEIAESLQEFSTDTRKNLLDAQNYLQRYIGNQSKEDLQNYFTSLQVLTDNINAIRRLEGDNLQFKTISDDRTEELLEFNKLIDSIYKESKSLPQGNLSFELQEIRIESKDEVLETQITHVSDSVGQKKFFSRLKDAFKGNVDVKTDTVYIKTSYESTVDTNKIHEDLDSTVALVKQHYLDEFEKYKHYLSSKDKQLHRIYDALIVSGNNLMSIYEKSIGDFGSQIEQRYMEQNSVNHKVRRITVLGLLILTFFVLIVLMFYTRLTFMYEKELKEANTKISNHLNFKNRILGMLSHEVRSPLKIINIFINRIEKKTDDTQIKEYLKTIKFTNNSLLIQASQILEYAKNQNKPAELKLVNFNLKHEIDSIVNAFQPFIESRNNTFKTSIDVDAKVFVISDNVKIHQVFTNILGNANKFTENGQVALNVATIPVDDNHLRLQVTVSDTGIGISESDLKSIFEPYYQGVISDEIENIGVGLGLNLCKELIQLFDGNIEVESVLGNGTIVRFEMILKLSDKRES